MTNMTTQKEIKKFAITSYTGCVFVRTDSIRYARKMQAQLNVVRPESAPFYVVEVR